MIRFGAVAAVLLVVAGAAPAQEIGGRYRVDGTNFDDSRYGGTATIEFTSRNTCRIEWSTGTSSSGICMRSGNILTAAYGFEKGPIGLVIYRIRPDGWLEGRWTVADRAGMGSETLVPTR